MIMIGNTPRAMSRAGFLAVLGLGLLLPVLPTWGQQSGDDDKRIDKKEIIKKSVDDALKQIDVEKIMKLKDDVIKHLDNDLKLDKDLLKKIQIDVIQKLDNDLDKIPEDIIKNLDDLIKSADLKADSARFKDLYRTKDELKKALAQLIEARVQIEDPEHPKGKDQDSELRNAMAQVEQARARLQQAQEQVRQAQRRLLEVEKQVRQLQQSRARQENIESAAKVRDEVRRLKEAKDKPDWKEKVERSRKDKTDKPKDGRRSDEDLEQRFERLLKEVQDLGRELKRRRAEDRRPDRDEQEEESAKP